MTIDENTFRELKKYVEIPNEEEVRDYLDKHDDMQPMVLDVSKKAHRIFKEEDLER
jgi:hypothetical protein